MTSTPARPGHAGSRFYLLAGVPFVAAFMLTPSSLYLHAGEDWAFTPYLLPRLTALGLAAYLAMAIVLRLVVLASGRAGAVLAAALFGLGLWLVLAHVYAPIAIGPLDGQAIESDEPLGLSLREAGFAVLAMIVFVQLARQRWIAGAAGVSIALVLIATGYMAVAMTRSEPAYTELDEVAPAPRAGGSVYHFVLDEMQTDAFLHLVDELDAQDDLRGFQLFRNNISNYRTTHTSSASYFTGTLFRQGGFGGWREKWKEQGLFSSLQAAGYRTWMYAPYEKWREALVDHFWYMRDVYEHETGTADSDFGDFAPVWLLSLVPNALTNEAVPAAQDWGEALARLFTGGEQPLTVPNGLNQVASVMVLEQALRHEELRSGAGEYVYVHAILPHGPFVVDRTCDQIDPKVRERRRAEREGPFDRDAYLAQGACAVRLIGAFLDRLRELGRYDSSTIVIHADTGFGRGLLEPAARVDEADVLGYPPQRLVSMVNALLMIKPPDAAGRLEVVDRPTQLIDLYPTLVDLLELPPPPYQVDGRSIFGPDRQEMIFAIDPEVRSGSNLVEVRVEQPEDLETSAFTVLGPPRRDTADQEAAR
ncbi:MAG: sulfatase-like hydrolase/transferase [Geminicoccaceae bacterium]|nr:sulfatase-like hydrolase/transferase [Geminicoccaceae bacterium]